MKFPNIYKKPILSIAIGLLIGAMLLAPMFNKTEPVVDASTMTEHKEAAGHADNEHHGEQAGAAHAEDKGHGDAEHHVDGSAAGPSSGPHGGQLYLERDFALEIKLEEQDGKAKHRIWLSEKNTPLPPTSVTVAMRLIRPNGDIQDVIFSPDKDSLVGAQAIAEPHMFKASIKVQRGNDSVEFLLNSDEGKIVLNDGQIKTAGIAVDNAGPARISSMTSLAGEIKFNEDRTAHVVPRLAGVVDSVSADLGQQVKKGQVLAVIASVQLSELRSELLSAQKRQVLAQLTFEREKKLWQDKISAEQDYLQAQQHLQETTIAAQNVRQKLSALGAGPGRSGALSLYELRAPFDGMIIEKHIALGEAVKEDANVFMISDLSTVWAEIIVPAKDLAIVRVGEKATVRAASMDSVSNGKISYVGSLLGEQTRTAKARITLANPDAAWRPGLFVNVELRSNDSEVPVAVRSDALQTIDDKPVVFIRVDGGFIAQTVVTGKSDGKTLEIMQGLSAGTPYAAAGSFVLKAEQGKGSAEHAH
jgi:cobalt-zinc-cadmium efflux system membrane fusion protein